MNTLYLMRYRILLLAGLLAATLPLPAQAQLGIDSRQVGSKYGTLQGELKPVRGADKAVQYATSHQLYNLHFKDNKLVMIQVAGRRLPLTPQIAGSIMEQHKSGTEWGKAGTEQNRWITKNGAARAEYDPKRSELYIYSSVWQAKQFPALSQDNEKPEGDAAPAGQISSDGETKGGTSIFRK